MRVFDLQAFLKLPAGTVYAKIPTPIIIEALSVKADSLGDADWVTLQIPDWQSEGSGDWADRYYQMLEENVSVPAGDMYGRDGTFDKEDKFLVFERADLLGLREILDEALKLPDLPKPSRTLTKLD